MRHEDGILMAGLAQHGVSRRSFMKFCATLASVMALPPAAGLAMAEAMADHRIVTPTALAWISSWAIGSYEARASHVDRSPSLPQVV